MKFSLSSSLSFLGTAAIATTVATAAVVSAPVAANAAGLTYNLNCVNGGANICTPSSLDFGKIEFTQQGANSVEVSVDLTGTGVHKVLELALNFDPDPAKSALLSGLTITPIAPSQLGNPAPGYDINANSLSLSPFTGFDIFINPKSSGSTNDPFKVLITGLNLSVNDFDFANSSGIFAAVHIGNYLSPGVSGNDSIKVGYLKPTRPVPVPGFLLGVMAAGALGGTRLLKNKKKDTQTTTV